LLRTIGLVHEKKGDDRIALDYFRKAIDYDRNQKGEYLLSMDYIALANYFLKKNYYDSSLYYANLASILAHHSSVLKNIMEASELLTKGYQAKHQIDSAFKYQGILQMAKDSLFSQEKVRHIQFLSYKEDQRQKQIAEEKAQAKEERRKNLQLIGISVFIISFILFVIILGRRRVKPRTIEFFGVISLLMLFEFINLFIHPFIEVWTHHSQVEMLLILVAVAAILVPLHHRMEKWVKHSLAKKKLLKESAKEKVDELPSAPRFAELDSPI
jgi:tetratricopeptide (TPR) repeat protein